MWRDHIVFAGLTSRIHTRGIVVFRSGVLEDLLRLQALEVVPPNVGFDDICKAPAYSRWEVAGGKVESFRDAVEMRLCDGLRRRWYKTRLNLEIDPDE